MSLPSQHRDQDSMGLYSDSPDYAFSGRIMVCAMIILVFVVILMLCLHIYTRRYLLRPRRYYLHRRSRNHRRPATIFFIDPSTFSAPGSLGLDPAIVKSLPIFNFSASTHPGTIECPVCLSEFEENDLGRVLPNCKHTFHVECIDMWFHSHSTCPLCRSLVEPIVGEEIPAAEEVVITIPDDLGSSCRFCDTRITDEGAGTSAAQPSNEVRDKPAAIEVPRRNPGEFDDESTPSESPGSHSFRSPVSRMLSFTRNLMKDRRTAPAAEDPSSSSESSSTTVNESEPEPGRGEGSR